MNAITQTLWACLATGAVFTSLCAAVSVPVLAWLVVRGVAFPIKQMNTERAWQSWLAALAAATPGLIFFVLILYGLAGAIGSPCLQTVPGRVIFGGLALLGAGALLRAIILWGLREREVRELATHARTASERLAAAARSVSLRVYELLDDRRAVVMLAGTVSPRIYASSRALAQLDDAELRAALQHEQAHFARRDHVVAPLVHFLSDLLPLRVDDLIATYRHAREFCADRCALVHVLHTDLAGALLRLAHGSPNAAPVVAFADSETVRSRLDVLLRPPSNAPQVPIKRLAIALVIAVTAVVGAAAPLIASAVVHCGQMPS
ncbi:MAG TPA: M56 family metallopeptidase [Candidatus Baltobacteraceae bacterium]|jgi:beta-lactamase regulating signal transducer with metallopeptidase domain|nr:M56 family metallopeptidase [Candidatus Baltobacteraceae bacterium]